jgi:hypothetical protein
MGLDKKVFKKKVKYLLAAREEIRRHDAFLKKAGWKAVRWAVELGMGKGRHIEITTLYNEACRAGLTDVSQEDFVLGLKARFQDVVIGRGEVGVYFKNGGNPVENTLEGMADPEAPGRVAAKLLFEQIAAAQDSEGSED